ncbi:hypothetical protein Tco_0806172 [Tanacetum coccineum]
MGDILGSSRNPDWPSKATAALGPSSTRGIASASHLTLSLIQLKASHQYMGVFYTKALMPLSSSSSEGIVWRSGVLELSSHKIASHASKPSHASTAFVHKSDLQVKFLASLQKLRSPQVTGTTSSGPSTSETPKVLASGMYTNSSKSKGHTVADSIAERLTRPTAYKFKTDCSIIPVWVSYEMLMPGLRTAPPLVKWISINVLVTSLDFPRPLHILRDIFQTSSEATDLNLSYKKDASQSFQDYNRYEHVRTIDQRMAKSKVKEDHKVFREEKLNNSKDQIKSSYQVLKNHDQGVKD